MVLFALPYCAVYCASVYLLAMNESERALLGGVGRKLLRRIQ